ncbi:MAG: hypothetical protein WA208_21845 [Thermoanaerobaculia bacterium]
MATLKASPKIDEADVVAAIELRDVLTQFAAGTAARAVLTDADERAIVAIRSAAQHLHRETVGRTRSGCMPIARGERVVTADLIARQLNDYLKLIESAKPLEPALASVKVPAIESAAVRDHAQALAQNIIGELETFVDQRRNFERIQGERARALEAALRAGEDADPVLRNLIAAWVELRLRIQRRDANEATYRLAVHDLRTSVGYLLPIDPETGKRMSSMVASDVIDERLSRSREAAA